MEAIRTVHTIVFIDMSMHLKVIKRVYILMLYELYSDKYDEPCNKIVGELQKEVLRG